MIHSTFKKVQLISYTILGVLLLSLLGYLASHENIVVSQLEHSSGITQINNVQISTVENESTPCGTEIHYQFTLDQPVTDDLAISFYSSHHWVDVYMDGECVYTHRPSNEISLVRTPGCNWYSIPLQHTDEGREILIVMTPVYQNFHKTINILLAPVNVIYRFYLHRSLPELILSSLNISVGLGFLAYGLFHFTKSKGNKNSTIALGVLAISTGLWRLTDTMFSPFLLESKPTLLFYTSVTMLGIVCISLLQSSKTSTGNLWQKIRASISTGMVAIISGQILIQRLGLMDIRESLTLIHIMLLISSSIIVIERVVFAVRSWKFGMPSVKGNSIWLLGIGILLDLIAYFLNGTSSGLLFTLLFILLFVILEGIKTQYYQITENQRLSAELEQLTFTDSLTGLLNRNQYMLDLRMLEVDPPQTLGLILMDINGLRGINDTHGLMYGDQVLKRIAQILQRRFSGGLYRIGGDEFMVICKDISKDEFQDHIISLRTLLNTEQICEVSIGLSWSEDQNSMDLNTLRNQAQEMCISEKQSYYHNVLRDGSQVSRTSLASEVLQEIESGSFTVYYQPQIEIQSGLLIGAEALVRKISDDGSLIPPSKFIPFYEVGGVISHVDLFVLRSACVALQKWRSQGHKLRISVNFSRTTLLEPRIVEVISKICEDHMIPPSAITIEVTESISKMDTDQLQGLIQRLKEKGFTISLDDFGSQYSNLAILSAMDFDEIKFDRSLISTLEKNEKSQLVIANSLQLCRAMVGTESLAEGIETKGQLELLAEYQCQYGQGFYFSRPLPMQQFESFMQGHNTP